MRRPHSNVRMGVIPANHADVAPCLLRELLGVCRGRRQLLRRDLNAVFAAVSAFQHERRHNARFVLALRPLCDLAQEQSHNLLALRGEGVSHAGCVRSRLDGHAAQHLRFVRTKHDTNSKAVAARRAMAGGAWKKHQQMLEQQWYDPRYHPNELIGDLALEYFMQADSNPFYERTSINQRLRQVNAIHNRKFDRQQLTTLRGIEYDLEEVQQPVLHLIHKRDRTGTRSTTHLETYYMVRGNVFQCPDVGSVVDSRLRTALHHLDRAFDSAQSSVCFHPATGDAWNFGGEDTEAPDEMDELKRKFKADPFQSKRRDKTSSRRQTERVEYLINAANMNFPCPAPSVAAPPS
eukprot:m.208398 g.208398  ORF g.208398 m.208398 type:complete len:349 (+) comp10717_c0_seq2:987-2033(+)